MATNVNDFKLFVEFVSNKVQSGATVSPSQFNMLAHQSQMQVFERDYDTFIRTEEISSFLSFFLKEKVTSVLPTGFFPYPTDFQHTSSIRSYYVRPLLGSTDIPVEEVKNSSWGAISTSQLQEPTKRFPKYSEFADGIRFLPKDIGTIMFDYFKTPVKPVWGFTGGTTGSAVYDPASSTDFEWDSFATNGIAAVYLGFIGINLKSAELAAFAAQFKAEVASEL